MSLTRRAVVVAAQSPVASINGAGNLENPNQPISADTLAAIMGAGNRSAAGIVVTEATGTRQVTALACIRLIAEVIATLPVGAFEKVGNRRAQVADAPWMPGGALGKPNEDQEWGEVVEDVLVSTLGWGNGVSQLVRSNRSNDVLQILPQVPNTMIPRRRTDNNRLVYDSMPSALSTGTGGEWDKFNVMHVKGFRGPGTVWGVSPITHHRNAFGLAQAAEQFGAAFFGNGAQASGFIRTPAKMTKEMAEVFLSTYLRDHQGVGRAHRPGVLTEGAEWQQNTIPPEDAQFLETRKYQDAEIARIYRVPPHLVGDVERSTSWGTGIEEQGLNFVIYTLRTWIVKLEAALSALLPRGQFVLFNVEGLLRGTIEARYKAYAVGRQWGWLSANDILAMEDAAPLPEGGDTYLSPLNMIDAADLTSRPLRDRSQAASFLALAGFGPEVIAPIVGLSPGDIGPLLPNPMMQARIKAALDAIDPDDDEPSGPDPSVSDGGGDA